MKTMLWLLLLTPLVSGWYDVEPPLRSLTRNQRANVSEGYVDVRLDHFHAQNTDTFPMRYYYNGEFADRNSSSTPHIVIFVGGEWEITEGWLRTGLAYELANATGAGLFYTEHRFYGLTRPTEDTGVQNLRYLTVDQAIGDLAQFIQHVKSQAFMDGKFSNAKVALIGCSYAGSMATWMRLGYPHVVDVAFSDSGPLLAQEDFPEYIETMSSVLRSEGGEACYASIDAAMEQIAGLLNNTAGRQVLSNLFNTCTPLSDSPLDQVSFFQGTILTPFAYLVQYAVEGDIEGVCAKLTDVTVSDSPVHRLANWVKELRGEECAETRYTEYVAAYTNTSYDSKYTTGRLWMYQTCVEFGWYQTTSESSSPFLNAIPLEYYHQACRDFFGPDFSELRLRSGIDRTNILWGGLRVPDDVVTVQGGHDPWSPLGPAEHHATYLSPVYVIDNVSHCRAIGSTGETENQALENTKRAVLNKLSSVLTGELMFDSGAASVSLALAVALFSVVAVTVV